MRSGKWVMLGLLILGLVAALFAVWVRQQMGLRALQYWGQPDALLVRDAPEVFLLTLEPVPEGAEHEGESLTIAGAAYVLVNQRDAALTSGMTHIRAALLADSSFDWASTAESTGKPTGPLHALRFSHGARQLTLAFERSQRLIIPCDDPRPPLEYAPASALFDQWLDEQLPTAAAP